MSKKEYLVILLSLLISGCSILTQDKAKAIISPTNYLNPDSKGRAKPLTVTVMLLTSPYPFKAAKFSSLTETPEEILHTTLLDLKKLTIRPGKTMRITVNLPENTKYIGVIGEYHDIKNSHWKSIVKLPNTYEHISFRILAETQSIEVQAEENLL